MVCGESLKKWRKVINLNQKSYKFWQELEKAFRPPIELLLVQCCASMYWIHMRRVEGFFNLIFRLVDATVVLP